MTATHLDDATRRSDDRKRRAEDRAQDAQQRVAVARRHAAAARDRGNSRAAAVHDNEAAIHQRAVEIHIEAVRLQEHHADELAEVFGRGGIDAAGLRHVASNVRRARDEAELRSGEVRTFAQRAHERARQLDGRGRHHGADA